MVSRNINLSIEDLDAKTPEEKRRAKARAKIDATIQMTLEDGHKKRRTTHTKDSSDDEHSQASSVAPKRRGRKRERDDKYFEKQNIKVAQLRRDLENAARKGDPVQRRKQLRNQISAAEARVRTKRESMFLNRVTRDKDQKLLKLLTFLGNNLPLDQLI